MPFRRDKAADTLVAVAAALRAAWSAMPPETQSEIQKLIDRFGPEIYEQDSLNRASRVVALLDGISNVQGLPASVLDALAAGAGTSATILVRIDDGRRDDILEALRQVYDARRYADPGQLAEDLRIRIAQQWRQLDQSVAHQWEALDTLYQSGGRPTDYLREIEALLADKLRWVQVALEQAKTWSRAVQRSAGPPKSPLESAEWVGESAPPAAEPEGAVLERAVVNAQPEPATVRRFANVYFPETIQITQKMTPLIVHLAQKAVVETVTVREGSAAVTVTVGDLSIFVHAEAFDIEAAIGGAEVPGVPFGRSVAVRPESDSEPVVFFLSPTEAGDKSISIEFYQGRKRRGSLAFGVKVVDEMAQVGHLMNARIRPLAIVAPDAEGLVDAPALDLRVMRLGNGLTYGYFLTSEDGRYTEEKLGEVTLGSDPLSFFKSRVEELSTFAAVESTDRTPEERQQTISRLHELGAHLYDELLPARFKEEYRGVLRSSYAGKTLVITSDEPWIPWEMVRPFERGPNGRILYSDPFLCEQFRLTRRLSGSGARDRLSVTRGVFVAPRENLAAVQEEVAFFQQLEQADSRVQWAGPLVSMDDVNREFAGGQAQTYHFSCHGNFRYDDPTESMLKIGDNFLRPSNIRYNDRLALWQSAPLVFLNACHSGQAGLTLTRLGGWAESFLGAGASAFVGSLWEINDKLAAQFAREFYRQLWGLEGRGAHSIGEAFYAARMTIKQQDEANPTWLAYVLYGDPNGQVTFGE